MDYTIKQVAEMSGVSNRTLRFYHEEKLLEPREMNQSGYRIYGEEELERLQQILLYKELGLKLTVIKQILDNPDFDFEQALKTHKSVLATKRASLDQMIRTVEKTLATYQGGEKMSGEDKFMGFKKEKIAKNEQIYGMEIREKYGEETIDLANQKLMNLTIEENKELEETQKQLFDQLAIALKRNVVEDALQLLIFELHRKWLQFYWPKYEAQAHFGLAQMYLIDERFTNYYDKQVGDGATRILCQSIQKFTQKKNNPQV